MRSEQMPPAGGSTKSDVRMNCVLQLSAALLFISILTGGFPPIGKAAADEKGQSKDRAAIKSAQLTESETEYSVIDLGTLGGNFSVANGLNDNGVVVGQAATAGNVRTPFIWNDDNSNDVSDPGEMKDLNAGNPQAGKALSININGQVTGDLAPSGTPGNRPFVWHNGAMTFLATRQGVISDARSINNIGTVVGGIAAAGQGDFTRAVEWQGGAPSDLQNPENEESYANDVNSSGSAVGYSQLNGPGGWIKPILWQNGNRIPLLSSTPAGLHIAFAVGDSGHVVGYSQFSTGLHAFLWKDGSMSDLGTLGGSQSTALDVNDAGIVVGNSITASGGSRAFRWKAGNGGTDPGGMVDLNTLIDPNRGWELTNARGINSSGQIVGDGRIDGQTHAFLLTPKVRRPVLIVPGIAGTYAASASNDMGWLLHRGVPPSSLQIDPLARVYHDLIKTFENVGYVKDKDLFIVNYDWRLLPGPSDANIDGIVSEITATSISDEHFAYGVDYLGLALKKAYERWELDHPDETPLEEVDIVAHSTGGLVSRTYIQSPAYNTAFSGKKKLPKVKNMIMVGVPNRGASKAWNALHDNWNADIAYKAVLSKIISRAYLKVLIGNTISGPDYNITFNSILDSNGHPDPIKFIDLYVPTIRSLLATYDFLDLGTGYANVNSDPNFRNQWLLDLNSGYDLAPSGDPSRFAEKCKATIIYAGGHETLTFTKKILTGGEDVLFNFDDIQAGDVPVGVPWFMDIPSLSGGDGTVPVISSTGQFVGDDRVTLKQIIAGNPDHTGLMSNLDAQIQILETIDTPFEIDDISMEFAGNQYLTILGIVSDPVDSFLIDGKGRRLGYSEATGVVNEIPGGVWFGDADGAGWIFGDIERPLRVELTGRGEPFYYIASADSPDADGGVVDSGFLEKGEKKNLEVAIGTTSLSGRITDSRGRGIQGAMVTLTDDLGIQRRAATSSFGYYIFHQVPSDVTYQVGVKSKRFSFIPPSRSVFAENNISGIDFISIE